MRRESLALAISVAFAGSIIGWMFLSQRPPDPDPSGALAESASPGSAAGVSQELQPAPIDEATAQALRDAAERDPADPGARVELGNLYFDARRFGEAIGWYEAALELDPSNVNVSTDLGVSYYYTNQPDRALAQFERSLEIDPTHTKTMLNMGIVRAFGMQDLAGAEAAWEQAIQVAPDSPEGQAARQALERIRAAHPRADDAGRGAPPGSDE